MMEVERSYRIVEITDGLKPPYQTVRQANVVGDPVVGMLVPDTRLQTIEDAYRLWQEGKMRTQELYNAIEDALTEGNNDE